MRVDSDAQDLVLDAPAEALDHAVGLQRVGLGGTMRDAEFLAGAL